MKNYSELAKSCLLSFVISQNAKYKVGPHHRKIANALDEIAEGKNDRLIINMPPRFGKSMLVNQYFISYYLGLYPEREVITTTYSQDKANDFGRNVRNLMMSEKYLSVFPESKLAEDSQSASKFSLEKGGNLFAVGANGALTGRGASLVIVDDIVKSSETVRSITQTENLREWFSGVLSTRLTNNGAIVVVMTRWSLNDLAGWLIDEQKNEWKVLTLPALDEDNRSTWEEMFSTETLLRTKKNIGSKIFNCLYQQKPEPIEDAIVKREWIKFHNYSNYSFDRYYISWDVAFTGNITSDFTVGVVIGQRVNDPNFYIVDIIRDKLDFNQTRKKLLELSHQYKGAVSIIEQAANGFSVYQSLKSEIAGMIPIKVSDSKISRMMAIAHLFEAGNVYFSKVIGPKLIDECISELVHFPRGRNDDFCDALSQGLSYINNGFKKYAYADLASVIAEYRYEDFRKEQELIRNPEMLLEQDNEPEIKRLFPHFFE